MGKKIRNKGLSHEIHRVSDDFASTGKSGKRNKSRSREFCKEVDRIRGWFTSLIPKMEKDFSTRGKIDWHGKLYKVLEGDKFVGCYLPLLPSEEKLSIQIDTIKKKALEIDADAAMVVYYKVKMENQEKTFKNQEYVELIFETKHFNKKYIWNVCRQSGKLPWLENGHEDKNYEGGRLL